MTEPKPTVSSKTEGKKITFTGHVKYHDSMKTFNLSKYNMPPDAIYVFDGCTFEIPVVGRNLVASRVEFKDCVFACKVAGNPKGEGEIGTAGNTLDFNGLRADHFSMSSCGSYYIIQSTNEGATTQTKTAQTKTHDLYRPARLAIDLSACVISDRLEIKIDRKAWSDTGPGTPNSKKDADHGPVWIRAKNGSFKGRCDIDLAGLAKRDDGYRLAAGGLGLGAENRFYDFVLSCEGGTFSDRVEIGTNAKAVDHAGLPVVAIEAPEVIIGGQLTLRGVQFQPSDGSGRPKFDLRRGKINHLVFKSVPQRAFQAKAFAARETRNGIALCRIDLVTDELDDQPPPKAEGEAPPEPLSAEPLSGQERAQFWIDLAELTAKDAQKPLYVLAEALDRSGERSVADVVLAREKEALLELELTAWLKPLPKWLNPLTKGKAVSGKRVAFVATCVVVVSFIAVWGLHWAFWPADWPFNRTHATVALAFVWMGGLWLYRKRKAKDSSQTLPEFLFNTVVFAVMKSGIRPLRPLSILVFIWLVSALAYDVLASKGMMVPDRLEVTASTPRWNQVDMAYRQLAPTDVDGSAKTVIQGSEWPTHSFARMATAHGGPFDLTKHASLSKKEKKAVKRMFSWIHATDILEVCRRNWTNPGNIAPEVWVETLVGGLEKKHCGTGHDDDGLCIITKDADTGAKQSPWRTRLTDAFDANLVTQTCARFLPPEYSTFNAWLYAADVVIPLLDLRQEREWSIRATRMEDLGPSLLGIVFIALESLFILVGWLIALILAGAVTGLSDPRRRPF
ncbi:hypothetical protein [Tropicibacter naphthalenivorans]|uniref:Uncharacterized protein n=1 Tax=Tropicibacter naphthalenivorans TaxID=441103 RepID=A0A0P1GKF6_9RHOB|nr:hypothetical protein [Tropicibacter naphthalenivorans]CUH82370.1 hypothetical protein TRN7648_03934 [Tropicibacter naphthalenivorans]SMD05395.1 hypothetical protein SAMN04488093_1134 [Tropicibacter naphthalenivorans]